MPHLLLTRMPPSASSWRAYALLIDADALAAQGRYDQAGSMLEILRREFPDHALAVHASRLLAWTYAQQGRYEEAIETEKAMLTRYAAVGDQHLAGAYLNRAHILMNQKSYGEAAAAYEDFLARFPDHPEHCRLISRARLLSPGSTSDAVDR
jgi:tetratricopeptide (TPR) repeat protein